MFTRWKCATAYGFPYLSYSFLQKDFYVRVLFHVNVLMSRVRISQMFSIIKVENKHRRGSMATTYFREHLRHIIFSNPTPLSRVQYNSQMSSTAAALPSVGLLSTQWFWLGPIP